MERSARTSGIPLLISVASCRANIATEPRLTPLVKLSRSAERRLATSSVATLGRGTLGTARGRGASWTRMDTARSWEASRARSTSPSEAATCTPSCACPCASRARNGSWASVGISQRDRAHLFDRGDAGEDLLDPALAQGDEPGLHGSPLDLVLAQSVEHHAPDRVGHLEHLED